MESVEANARNVEDAVQIALNKLGATKDEVEITVLSEGRSGILGLGAEDARVRVTRKDEVPVAPQEEPAIESADVVAIGTEVLETLLKLMGVKATVTAKQPVDEMDGTVLLDISGEDLGILIGRRGETLASLQFIANLIVGKKTDYRSKVAVDVEGYRLRRTDSLRGLALRMADRVKQTGQSITMEAMPPAERRIIHVSLADHPEVETHSIGEGEHRKVVITPRRS